MYTGVGYKLPVCITFKYNCIIFFFVGVCPVCYGGTSDGFLSTTCLLPHHFIHRYSADGGEKSKILCVSTTSCFIPVTPVTPQILDIMHLVWTLTLFHGIKRLVCIYIPVLFIYLELQSGTYTSQHSLHINPADYSILVSRILLSLMKTDK